MVKTKFAPLSSGFLLVSMLGFVFSALFISKWDLTYGFTFSVIFLCMFIASMQSMKHANPDSELRM